MSLNETFFEESLEALTLNYEEKDITFLLSSVYIPSSLSMSLSF